MSEDLWPEAYWSKVDQAADKIREQGANAKSLAESEPTQGPYCWSHFSYYCTVCEAA